MAEKCQYAIIKSNFPFNEKRPLYYRFGGCEIPDEESSFAAMLIEAGGEEIGAAVVGVPRHAVAGASVARRQLQPHQRTFRRAHLLE